MSCMPGCEHVRHQRSNKPNQKCVALSVRFSVAAKEILRNCHGVQVVEVLLAHKHDLALTSFGRSRLS